MTSLVGASVLLIAGSALALVFGWVTANESLIWTSIAASVASGVALALAYGRARTEGPSPVSPEASAAAETTSNGPEAAPSSGPREAAPAEREETVTPTPKPVTPTPNVVGVRHSKRFHKPTCRYATAKNAEHMSKAEAVARGYRACGICKP